MDRDYWRYAFVHEGTVYERTIRPLAHESSAEFDGRAWCEVEASLGRRAGDPPVEAGTRIALMRSPLARYYTLDAWMQNPPLAVRTVSIYESTGEPYANRWRFVAESTDWRRALARREA